MKHLVKVLVCLGLLSTTITGIQAEESQELHNQTTQTTTVEYSYEGSKIREFATANINGENIVMDRLINEDGSFEMIITGDNEQEIIEGIVDYELFEKITNSYIMNLYNPTPYNSDVTGSQYKHIYVGSSEATINKKTTGDFEDIVRKLTLLGFPAAAITAVYLIITNEIADSKGIDKVTVYSDTYEVQFTYDSGYYTHCYHQVVKSYDSGGHLIETYKDYQQVIGG